MKNDRPKCPICGKYTGREQVKKFDDMEETIHRQCVELNEWREKYRKLFEEKKAKSNGVSKEKFEELKKKKALLEDEVAMLRNRGFWARVFNK